jgi:4-hydroxy-tetrahydrodipicolinate synthase
MSDLTFLHTAWSGEVHGIVPVIPTPFDDREEVDFEALACLVGFAADAGVTAACLPAYGSEFTRSRRRSGPP